MRYQSALILGAAAAATAASSKHQQQTRGSSSLPSLEVPACPEKGTVTYDKSVPDLQPFPKTTVEVCYDDKLIHVGFTAEEETNFYVNPDYGINDPIYEYEVMETFIARGTDDPQTYLEFEVNPINVTWSGMIYNPTKVRAENATFGQFMITEPAKDGFTAVTELDRDAEVWKSDLTVPLGLFNVDDGQAKGTEWRMNFFRIVVSPDTFPDQFLGGWSPPDEASFHMSPFFGNVIFV